MLSYIRSYLQITELKSKQDKTPKFFSISSFTSYKQVALFFFPEKVTKKSASNIWLPPLIFIFFWYHHILMLFWFLSQSWDMSYQSLYPVLSKVDYSMYQSMREDLMGNARSLKRVLLLYCFQINILIVLQFPSRSKILVLNWQIPAGLWKRCQNQKLKPVVLWIQT